MAADATLGNGNGEDGGLEVMAQSMMAPLGDQELRTRSQDRLNRTRFADAMAAQIASVDPEQAVVFGVVGPWGSGKTSLLNMMTEALEQDHEGIEVLRFNPWLFSGTDHLVGIFFEELGAQLREKDNKRWEQVGQAMEGLGELLSNLRSIPVAGSWAGAAGGSLKIGGGLLRRKGKQPVSLEKHKQGLRKALRTAGRNIVIMVDDLDRLRQQEIRDVVASVRLNADLPNVLFVLAYDRYRVEKALGETEGDGRSYLEKIVQVVYDVPEARDVDLKGALLDAVSEATEAATAIGPYDPQRAGDVLKEIVSPMIRTIRDVKRYANALPVTLRAIGEEVALADVMGLEGIRLLLPEVYSRLSTSAEALTTQSDAYLLVGSKERAKKIIEELFDAGGDRKDVVENACELLFPAGLSLLRGNHYDSRQNQEAGRERRVANWRFLRFFLDKQLPQGVVPARRVQEVMDALGDPNRLLFLLEQENLEGLDRLMLRLQEYEEVFRAKDVMEAIPSISNRHAQVMTEAGRGIDLGADVSYGGLMRRMLNKVQDPEELTQQLKLILPRIDYLSARLELVTIVGYRTNTGEKLVSEEDAEWFEENMLIALEHASADSLAKEYALTRLLIRARQYDQERGNRLIGQLAADDQIFLAVLLRYYQQATTGVEDGQMHERRPNLRWNDLCSLFGEETAKRRVRDLKDRYGPEELGEPAAEALMLADSYVSGRPPDWEVRS